MPPVVDYHNVQIRQVSGFDSHLGLLFIVYHSLQEKAMSNSKGTKERCEVCKLRKRGSNHDEGSHHKAVADKAK